MNSREGCPEGISVNSCRGACPDVAIKGKVWVCCEYIGLKYNNNFHDKPAVT